MPQVQQAGEEAADVGQRGGGERWRVWPILRRRGCPPSIGRARLKLGVPIDRQRDEVDQREMPIVAMPAIMTTTLATGVGVTAAATGIPIIRNGPGLLRTLVRPQ